MQRRVLSVVISAIALQTLCASPVRAQTAPPAAPLTIAPPAAATETTTPAAETLQPIFDSILKKGSGEFAAEPVTPPLTTPLDPQKLDIAFENAPVGLVVQTLLSDYANANLIIDPRVKGEITLRSHDQITAAELPDFLKASVHAIGLDLLDRGPNTYLLRPTPSGASASEAPDLYKANQPIPAGGLIVPLKYVAAAEMAHLLAPFAKSGVTIEAEPTREFLILTGPPDQVEAIVKTVQVLDVDWLKGMSFGISTVESDPDALITDLQKMFGGASGPVGSMVEFVPLKSKRAILVLAKRPERLEEAQNWITQLDRSNRAGAGRLHVLDVHGGDAVKLADTVNGLYSAGANTTTKVTGDPVRNALIVDADPATFADIQELVANLDKAPDQVVIEATIAEVTLNNDLKYGVQWFFDTRNGGGATLSGNAGGAITASFPGFSYGFSSHFVQASLNALASKTKVEVISSPVLMTLDNQEAVLQIGDQVPIVTQSAVNLNSPATAVVNNVQYRDTGISLRVTPRIGDAGMVTMEVTQEASDVASTTTSGIDSPTIRQRKFQSKVMIGDGETVALGGLIRASKTKNNSGVPFAKDIPVLGAAFRNTETGVNRTELVVFLTPKIIRTKRDAAAVTDELRARLERVKQSSFIRKFSYAAPAH